MCKKIINLLIICSLIIMTFSACSARMEIDKLIVVRLVAVDKSEDGDGVELTIGSEKSSSSSKGEKSQNKQLTLHSEGETLFDASRNFQTFAEKDVFWAHTKFIVLGEAVAREDVLKYLDFFVRDHENRLNSIVTVIRNGQGSDTLKLQDETPTHKILSSLYENMGHLSISKEILLSEFLEKMDNKYFSAYLPCIQIINDKESNKSLLSLDGFAVFKENKLIDFITGKVARGLNWINGDVKTGLLVVKDQKGSNISLELIDSAVKIETTMENDEPKITVKIWASANVGELQGQAFTFEKEDISLLDKQLSDIIKDEVESVIKFAQQNNVDILGFGDKIFHQHPVKWEKIKDNWSSIFPNIDVKVKIESRINRTYNIKEPIRFWGSK